MVQGLGATLRILDMENCKGVGEYGDRGLKDIGANCQQLKELHYTGCRRTADGGIVAVAKVST